MRAGTSPRFDAEVFAGSSAAAERLRMQVMRFAPHFRTMLLVGEAGTGKAAVARELFRAAELAGPFAEIEADAFTLPVESAGAVYLRHVERLSPAQQVALPALLDRLPRETRVIAGCEGEPRGMLAAGRMRPELLGRLGMLEIRLTPLRERTADLEAIATAMLARWDGPPTERETLALMREHGWPGNLLELWECCRGLAHGESPALAGRAAANEGDLRLDDVMRRHVLDVLERCAGNKLRAAELLGISRSTLYRMLDAQAA